MGHKEKTQGRHINGFYIISLRISSDNEFSTLKALIITQYKKQ